MGPPSYTKDLDPLASTTGYVLAHGHTYPNNIMLIFTISALCIRHSDLDVKEPVGINICRYGNICLSNLKIYRQPVPDI